MGRAITARAGLPGLRTIAGTLGAVALAGGLTVTASASAAAGDHCEPMGGPEGSYQCHRDIPGGRLSLRLSGSGVQALYSGEPRVQLDRTTDPGSGQWDDAFLYNDWAGYTRWYPHRFGHWWRACTRRNHGVNSCTDWHR